MPVVRVAIALCALIAAASTAHANEPFYKGKRLTVLINFAAGGPTDIEGRLFAKHSNGWIAWDKLHQQSNKRHYCEGDQQEDCDPLGGAKQLVLHSRTHSGVFSIVRID